MNDLTEPRASRASASEWRAVEFGELLRSCRVRRGMTQRQLADLSTVSVRAIRDIEQGKALRPRLGTVRLIADGLGLTGRGRADFEAAAGHRTMADLRRMIYGAEPAAPPAPLDGLVGREAEVAALRDFLASGSQRLITITGLGSVGKTRVAIEVAGLLHSSIGLPVLWTSVADLAGANGNGGQSGARSPLAQVGLAELLMTVQEVVSELGTVIGDRAALLVLDGYQPSQVRVDRIVPLLRECRGLRVLVTSRAPFDIRGERTFPLPPLPVPQHRDEYDPASLAASPSVRLLMHYIHQVQPTFELTSGNADAVAELCRRLDGIPAALEVVAPWFQVYEPELLVQQINADPISFVERAAGETSAGLFEPLRQALHSLTTDERSLLARLAGGGTSWSMSEAAELTGIPNPTCARLIQRLLMLGVVRPVDDQHRSQFVVLDLVRALYAQPPAARVPRPRSAAHDDGGNGRALYAGAVAGTHGG